ncbi:LysR family transcriptional regulator [Novosphingobium sp. 1949]|uniref:LysR family transcriptional regulator n=1 Tax=Novosphingobium organovorum TaxID=2930092 RepID=A0ABT0BEM5_9SPHN|nr:LysR family transcriptional regulator [Novosphingobium organovorum]MCJ2183459.1 LysR family transcriptional regulator [Novosphingobium organovorum]
MIDPRALRIFLAVCRANSISGGARELNLSQPSVSNAIAQLERATKARLFERARTGITLTRAGELLASRSQAMENLLRDAESELRLAERGAIGPLRVGGTPGALVSLLPRALEQLETATGQFDLRVVERPDDALSEMLRSGEIELAFTTTGIGVPEPDIEEVSASQDPFALIVGRANYHLPDRISLRDVAGMRWVLPEARGAFRRQTDALFMAAEMPAPADAIRCDSLLTTKAIVRGGKRVTILPVQVASAELSIGVMRAITIEEAHFQRSIGIRRLRTGVLSPLAQALVDILIP